MAKQSVESEFITWQQLQPFNTQNFPPELAVFAAVNRVDAGLLLQYRWVDPRKMIVMPCSQNHADLQRRSQLWEQTCFEAFWSLPGEEAYWELNANTCQEYNIYAFESYRHPQPPQEDLNFWVTEMRQIDNILQVWLEGEIPSEPLQFSLNAILKLPDTVCLSTQHAGSTPDFHLRQGLTLIV